MNKESLNMIASHFGLIQPTNSDDKGTWKEGLPEALKLFVKGSASQDQDYSGSDISIDSDNLKCTRNGTREFAKRRGSKQK